MVSMTEKRRGRPKKESGPEYVTPINWRPTPAIVEALEAYRQRVAERGGFEPPPRARVLRRALVEYLTRNGFPVRDEDDD